VRPVCTGEGRGGRPRSVRARHDCRVRTRHEASARVDGGGQRLRRGCRRARLGIGWLGLVGASKDPGLGGRLRELRACGRTQVWP
jgi:hypothetical protein